MFNEGNDDLSRILNNHQQSNLDDFIEFHIYFDCLETKSSISLQRQKLSSSSHTTTTGDKLDFSTTEQYVFNRLIEINDLWEDFCREYAWTSNPLMLEIVSQEKLNQKLSHGESTSKKRKVRFDLQETEHETKLSQEDTVPIHLMGRVRVGDNVEEEWLIVHLLTELSSQIPDISISVYDADGELLLIESAMNLPSWLTPQTSKHRIWIRHGAIHIIPKTLPTPVVFDISESQIPPISISQAVKCLVNDDRGMFIARPSVQKSIHRRTKPFGSIVNSWKSKSRLKATTSLQSTSASLCERHGCRIIVPISIGLLLQRYPHLLGIALDNLPPQPNVIGKYLREASQYVKGQNIVQSGGSNTEGDNHQNQSEHSTYYPQFDCSDDLTTTVCVRVNLNRCQLARLNQLRFRLPVQFTTAKWRIPFNTTTCQKGNEMASAQMKLRTAIERGAKICLGLLSAFMANEGASSTLLAFFWDKAVTKDKNVTNQTRDRLQRFISLLEVSAEYQPSLKMKRRHANQLPLAELRVLLQGSSSVSTNNKYVEEPEIDHPKFKSVVIQSLKRIVSDYHGNISSGLFCSCPNKSNEERDSCGGVDCCSESDDEGWLEVSPNDVEKIISERQYEDRFRELLRKELCIIDSEVSCMKSETHPEDWDGKKLGTEEETGNGRTPVIDRSQEETENWNSNDAAKATDQSQSVRHQEKGFQQSKTTDQYCHNEDQSKTGTVPTQTESLDASLDNMLQKFSELLDSTSGMEGIEQGFQNKSRRKISRVTKMKLKEKFPSEFWELLDDYNDSGSDPISDNNSTSSESWGNERLRELEEQTEEDYEMDDEMKEIMQLMDDELKEYSTSYRGTKPFQSRFDSVDNDELSSDGNSDNDAEMLNGTGAFREVNPMEMTAQQLSANVRSSFFKSREQEGFLEPGPASIILKSLNDLEDIPPPT